MGNENSQNLTPTAAPVVVYSKTTCPYCVKAKNLLQNEKMNYIAFELNKMAEGAQLAVDLRNRTGANYVPQIFICGKFIGGFSELVTLQDKGVLQKMAEECSNTGSVKVR